MGESSLLLNSPELMSTNAIASSLLLIINLILGCICRIQTDCLTRVHNTISVNKMVEANWELTCICRRVREPEANEQHAVPLMK